MGATRVTAILAGLLLALSGPVSTAEAAPSAAPSAKNAAAYGHAAPTKTYCILKIRKRATASSGQLWAMHNRNGSCPGSRGYDTIRCWHSKCTGSVRGGTYRCKSGGARHATWLPVKYIHQRAWVPIKCGTYVLP
ncbi:hypothetical protein ABZ840_24965 [Streptomyces sp. NPDC047117]|uniref:hypothetical protein n=1 Tax=unclassified Streptomyces TaxID=2593676 RepID=UPI0033D336EC